jgi:hypothetical protein
VTTRALALSSLFVLLSALVIPAWRNRHRESPHAGAVDALSLVALAAASAATTWLTWQVISLGVHDSPTQNSDRSSLLGSVFGIPVVVVPLAVLVMIVGIAEIISRTSGSPNVASPATQATRSSPAPAAAKEAPVPQVATAAAAVTAGAAPRKGRAGVGRFMRGDDRTLEAMMAELTAAEFRNQSALADGMNEIETRLSVNMDQHTRIQGSTRTAMEQLQARVAESATGMTKALDGISDACDRVTADIEAHQLERHVLTDAIALLKVPAPEPIDLTVGAADQKVTDSTEISLVDDEPTEISPVDDEPTRERAPAPPAYRAPDLTWRDYGNQRSGVLTASVKRLRQRAQSGWQEWARNKTRSNGNGNGAAK